MGYLLRSAQGQWQLFSDRVEVNKAVASPETPEATRAKLVLSQEVLEFARSHVGLHTKGNYETFVDLRRPYVSWVVSAAPKWEMKNYTWWFPIVGSLPYKGFFTEREALEYAEDLEKTKHLDTVVRGVSAYSSLGWFRDSILSSMLDYSEPDFVELLLHESTHATVYIASSGEFNEQLASFVGRTATLEFYCRREGPRSPTVKRILEGQIQSTLVSEFLLSEIQELRQWYNADTARQGKSLPADQGEALRQERLRLIQKRWTDNVVPKIGESRGRRFAEQKINNASLLLHETYSRDLGLFEEMYRRMNSRWKEFFAEVRQWEKSQNPKQELEKWLQKHPQKQNDSISKSEPAELATVCDAQAPSESSHAD